MNENPANYETKLKFGIVDEKIPSSLIRTIEIEGKLYHVVGISSVPKIESESKEAGKKEGVSAGEKEQEEERETNRTAALKLNKRKEVSLGKRRKENGKC